MPLLREIDLLLQTITEHPYLSAPGDSAIAQSQSFALGSTNTGRLTPTVKKALTEFVRSHTHLRIRSAHSAGKDVQIAIDACAPGTETGEVIALSIVRRGLIRKRVEGYLCTSTALHSSYLDGSHLPYEEIQQVGLDPNGMGVRISPMEGQPLVVDFGEFNEEVFQVLAFITDAIKSAQ